MSVETQTMRAADAARREAPIVVGYDGSPESKRALQVAAERAGPHDTVVPIHVTPTASNWLPGASSYEHVVEQTQNVARILLAEIDDINVGDARVEPELIEGEPAEALLRVARSRGAREIVIGSRGRGRFRSLLGSTSHALLAQADRPVVIIPQDGDAGAHEQRVRAPAQRRVAGADDAEPDQLRQHRAARAATRMSGRPSHTTQHAADP